MNTIIIIIIITMIIRNVLGTLNLGEILSQRESIANEMKTVLDVATAPWGVMVERVEVNMMVIVMVMIVMMIVMVIVIVMMRMSMIMMILNIIITW